MEHSNESIDKGSQETLMRLKCRYRECTENRSLLPAVDAIRSNRHTRSFTLGRMVKAHVFLKVSSRAMYVFPCFLGPVAQLVRGDTNNISILVMKALYPLVQLALSIGGRIRRPRHAPKERARIAAQGMKVSSREYFPCREQKSLPSIRLKELVALA